MGRRKSTITETVEHVETRFEHIKALDQESFATFLYNICTQAYLQKFWLNDERIKKAREEGHKYPQLDFLKDWLNEPMHIEEEN